MKLFSIKGGVHPPGHKDLSCESPIRPASLPDELHVPMRQHIGIAAEPVVSTGDHVLKGQLIGAGAGAGGVSANVHAPASGIVSDVGCFAAPHASGLSGLSVSIKPDGKQEWADLPDPMQPFDCLPGDIAKRVERAGIVGMGGAAFPSAVKLGLGSEYDLDLLIINGAECEPYITADDRLMRERAEEIIDGARIMAYALMVDKIIIAIEDNKAEAFGTMEKATADIAGLSVAAVPTSYPMGSEKHLIQALTGRETPGGAIPADIGVIMHNTATARAVREAVRFGRPLISRVVTISGGAVKEPANLEALIGTPIEHLVSECGGFTGEPERIFMGGPMMGNTIENLQAPLIKGNNGVLALTREEVNPGPHMPCIRCAACAEACPCGLQPMELAIRIRGEKLESAAETGLYDCIACGACAYVCPSYIPLVQYFSYAKGRLAEMKRVREQQERLRMLSESREARLERQEREKIKAREERKARLAAKKRVEAEA